MANNTSIEWTDYTWNPWEGCTKVSPGCAHCYAEARNHRFGMDNWGKGKPRRRTKDWQKPVMWNKDGEKQKRNDIGPFRLRSPRVFPSLCDWLDEEVPIEWLADFLKLIHDTPNLDWLLLTKRPENFSKRLGDVVAHLCLRNEEVTWLFEWRDGLSPPNVWLGVSVENQEYADKRIPQLLKIPAAIRFLSVEPMLGAVNPCTCSSKPKYKTVHGILCPLWSGSAKPGIDWVIYGGESGYDSRPCNVEWIRDGIRQCKAAGVPVFVKQLGAEPRFDVEGTRGEGPMNCILYVKHKKGGNPAEWPEDLRIRQFPS